MKTLPLLLALLLAAASGGVQAQPRDREHREERRERMEERRERREERAPRGIGRNDAARMAQERHGGRVLAVDAVGGGWRVKLEQRGDIRIVHIPAE